MHMPRAAVRAQPLGRAPAGPPAAPQPRAAPRRPRARAPPPAAAAPAGVRLLTPSCDPAATRRAVETLGEAFRDDPLLDSLAIRPSRRREFFKWAGGGGRGRRGRAGGAYRSGGPF
jgi:hypothetical protein